MGIGHVAFGLGLKSAHRPANAGLLIFAALLADFLLGWFVLARWESYQYPPGYDSAHYMLFTFPWSHGLLPLIGCGALLAWLLRRNGRVAALAAIAVVSHFLLDGLVHVKGLPVAGPASWEFGLGLWRDLPVALALESAMTLAALVLYWRVTRGRPRGWRIAVTMYVLLLGVVMIMGQVTARPQSRGPLIAGWIVAPVVFSWIAGVLDRKVEGSSLMLD